MSALSRILPVRDPRSEGQLSQFGVAGHGSASGWEPSSDSFYQEILAQDILSGEALALRFDLTLQ